MTLFLSTVLGAFLMFGLPVLLVLVLLRAQDRRGQ